MLSKGELTACLTASVIEVFSSAYPIPKCPYPLSPRTVFKSLKSRFTVPQLNTILVIVSIEFFNTESARVNADDIVTIFSLDVSSLSFDITSKVSTHFSRFCIPARATSERLGFSKLKGVVTTATVRIPRSLHILAMYGSAPVPVPPPIPAVRITIFASFIISLILSALSSAAA